MANEIKDVGNGNGYLYIVDITGNNVFFTLDNDVEGARALINKANEVGLIPQLVYGKGGSFNDVADPDYGLTFWIDADYGGPAVAGSITKAVEITDYVGGRSMNSMIYSHALTISGGELTITRRGVITKVYVDTEGSVATDDLESIAGDFVEGDQIIIAGVDSARVTTLKDVNNATHGNKNIHLVDTQDSATGDEAVNITLQYIKPNLATAGKWVEVARSKKIGNEYYSRVHVPTADVLSANSTPIVLIPAPGPNKLNVLKEMLFRLDFNTIPYATNGISQLIFDPAGTRVFAESSDTHFLFGTVSKIIRLISSSDLAAASDTLMIPNASLNYTVKTGDPTAGDSDLYFYIWYNILDL